MLPPISPFHYDRRIVLYGTLARLTGALVAAIGEGEIMDAPGLVEMCERWSKELSEYAQRMAQGKP